MEKKANDSKKNYKAPYEAVEEDTVVDEAKLKAHAITKATGPSWKEIAASELRVFIDINGNDEDADHETEEKDGEQPLELGIWTRLLLLGRYFSHPYCMIFLTIFSI